jgi:LmbE family N-acetylglucosaminyl deacetylase
MTTLPGRVLALSPHLDDAVWSIGGALADAARRGAEVTVATVLAGDPSSRAPAGRWDKRCGFRSAGKAAEVRQAEDRRACAAIGARPLHLPYWDESYDRGGDDGEIWAALGPVVDVAERVLTPGFPATHGDHTWLASLAAVRLGATGRLVLYGEEPYAMWALQRDGARIETPASLRELLPAGVRWERTRATRPGRAAKHQASRAYSSQLNARRGPYRLLPIRLAAHELLRGGELLGYAEEA